MNSGEWKLLAAGKAGPLVKRDGVVGRSVMYLETVPRESCTRLGDDSTEIGASIVDGRTERGCHEMQRVESVLVDRGQGLMAGQRSCRALGPMNLCHGDLADMRIRRGANEDLGSDARWVQTSPLCLVLYQYHARSCSNEMVHLSV